MLSPYFSLFARFGAVLFSEICTPALLVGVRGFPERDISSLCVMGWGWEMLGNSSAAVAAAAAPP